MINLHSELKSRDITLPMKRSVWPKLCVFPVVIYRCENWTKKKAECQRIDAFQLRHWRRLWRVPWTARRSNWSILKEINPEYSLEGLKLKLQYSGRWCEEPTHWKRPDARKDSGQEEKGATDYEMVGWHHRLNGHEFERTAGDGEAQVSPVDCSPWCRKESDTTEWLNKKPLSSPLRISKLQQ